MRHFAITGIVTDSWISRITSGSDMRETPPSRRMSAGTRSSAMTATAPDASAIFAWSALTTSMITPPLSISARPLLTRIVPYSAIGAIVSRPLGLEAASGGVELVRVGRRRPDEHRVAVRLHDVGHVRPEARRGVCTERVLGVARRVGIGREGDRQEIAARRPRPEPAPVGEGGD